MAKRACRWYLFFVICKHLILSPSIYTLKKEVVIVTVDANKNFNIPTFLSLPSFSSVGGQLTHQAFVLINKFGSLIKKVVLFEEK